MKDERIVRTRLEEREYKRLEQIADEDGISIEEALRRAIRSYVEENERETTDDPLFTVVDDLGGNRGDRTSAREMDVIYGPRGSEK